MYDKVVSLGSRLRYPITITKLLKSPGEAVKKQENIFEYKFTWRRRIGDDEWTDETTYTEFDSPAEGTFKEWRLREGQVVSADMPCMTVEEACGHEVQMQGLCSLCGADMTEVNWATEERDIDRANINMTHDQTSLMVSKNVARRAEHETQKRLLRQRKLSLVVDLDQTIIHACVDNTVGEWQKDPSNPNYPSVKDIKSFQLQEDANGFTYYIKQRPALSDFLQEMSKLYEMHVYTMGTRAYALSVAGIVDPDKKFFGNRVISRDENGSLTAKSLQRLFPVSTDMVVIIDDRSDVWPMNRPNLIKVVPYDFYKGIGDINSSFLPKRTDIPSAPASKGNGMLLAQGAGTNGGSDGQASSKDDSTMIHVSEEDAASMRVQEEEQEKTLEKQLADRPLLQMQEELDKEEEQQQDHGNQESVQDAGFPGGQHRTLLQDDDEELVALQDHLTDLHTAFYENYDRKRMERKDKHPHHPPGHSAKPRRPSQDDGVDLSMVPDIGEILEELKSDVLSGLVIVLSGLVPLGTPVEESEIGIQAQSFGAQVFDAVGPRVTHLVVSLERPRTKKVQQAAKIPSIRIVNQNWLTDCLSQWRRLDEGPYLMDVVPEGNDGGSKDHGQQRGDTTGDGVSGDEVDNDDDDDETTTDPGMAGGSNGLANFDWDKADEELEEFMGDEDLTSGDDEDVDLDDDDGDASTATMERDDDGDVGSEDDAASDAPGVDKIDTTEGKGLKRKHSSTNVSDGTLIGGSPSGGAGESVLAKKQRIARSRGASALREEVHPSGEGADIESGPGAESLNADDGGAPNGGSAVGNDTAMGAELDGGDVDFDDELARALEAELDAA